MSDSSDLIVLFNFKSINKQNYEITTAIKLHKKQSWYQVAQ